MWRLLIILALYGLTGCVEYHCGDNFKKTVVVETYDIPVMLGELIVCPEKIK